MSSVIRRMGFYIIVRPKNDSHEQRDLIAKFLTQKVVKYAYTCFYYESTTGEYNIYDSQEPGEYVYEWPELIHDNEFFNSTYCPTKKELVKVGFDIDYYVNVDIDMGFVDEPPVPIIACFKYKLKSYLHQSDDDLKSSQAYIYCLCMITYYFYLVSRGIEIDRYDSQEFFSAMAVMSKNESVYEYVGKYIKSFNSHESYDMFISATMNIPDLMKIETVITSYESGEDDFNKFKGVLLAQLISKLPEHKNSGSFKALIYAHTLRNRYFTHKIGNLWRYKVYNDIWNTTTSKALIAQAMASIRTQLRKFINDDIITVSDVCKADYDEGLSILSKSSGTGSLQNEVVHHLESNDYELMSKSYNKTLRFKDVVYDLRKRKARKPQPFDIQSNVIHYNFYNDKDPEIEQELDIVMETYFPEQEVREYVYQIFGRMLSGDVKDKSIWFFLGQSNTGKSAFMRLVKHAFGDMGDVLSGQYLNKKVSSSDTTTGINKAIGKLLGIIQEPRNGQIDVEAIKELTGDSEINIRMLFCEAQTIKNTLRYIVCANSLNLDTYDVAFWLRAHVVKFNTIFVTQEQYDNTKDKGDVTNYRVIDNDFESKIDRLAPALMSRFIEAYHKTEGELMFHPPIVNKYTKEFRVEHDITAKFFAENYLKVEYGGTDIRFDQVYMAFRGWYSAKQADRRNLITDAKLREAALSNGYIVSDGFLKGVSPVKIMLSLMQPMWSNNPPMIPLKVPNLIEAPPSQAAYM